MVSERLEELPEGDEIPRGCTGKVGRVWPSEDEKLWFSQQNPRNEFQR